MTVLVAGSVEAEIVSIAKARATIEGTRVTVERYVSLQDNLALNYNHRVRVTGVVKADTYGQLILQPSTTDDVKILQGASWVPARQVATRDVGEATEGLLVQVTGAIVRGLNDILPHGFSIFVDDGSGEPQIFIPANTGVNPFKIGYIRPGAKIRVKGTGTQPTLSASMTIMLEEG